MFIKSFKSAVKKLLLRALIWTEKGRDKTLSQRQVKSYFLDMEIHVPTYIVMLVTSSAYFLVFLFKIGLDTERIIGLMLMVVVMTLMFAAYLKLEEPWILSDDEAVTLLGFVAITMVLLMAGINSASETISGFILPIASASMLITMLLNFRLSVIMTIILAVSFGVINNFSFEYFFVGLLSGLTGAFAMLNVRLRKDISRAVFLEVMPITVVSIVIVILFRGESPFMQGNLNLVMFGVINSFLSFLIVIGFLPILEAFFSRTTNIRLLELADFNQPLLKRLMLEAPGTYHHSLVIASIAEQAAEVINANSLLCRVGAYYHDVGKLVKSEYFIENQMAMGNVHDELAPSMSSLVLISHVKEGIALAKEYNIDKAVVDFIAKHHGTSRIHYFYHRAIEQSPDAKIEEEDYRYPGPKPRSKETAIVMLADAVEAASRSLEDPTYSRIKDLVEKIFNNKFVDGQFDESPITLADLKCIADAMINSLASIYHARVEYPDEKKEK